MKLGSGRRYEGRWIQYFLLYTCKKFSRIKKKFKNIEKLRVTVHYKAPEAQGIASLSGAAGPWSQLLGGWGRRITHSRPGYRHSEMVSGQTNERRTLMQLYLSKEQQQHRNGPEGEAHSVWAIYPACIRLWAWLLALCINKAEATTNKTRKRQTIEQNCMASTR